MSHTSWYDGIIVMVNSFRILLLGFAFAIIAGGGLVTLRVMNQNESGGQFADVLIPTLSLTPAEAAPPSFLAKLMGADTQGNPINAFVGKEMHEGFTVPLGHVIVMTPIEVTSGITAEIAFDGAENVEFFVYEYSDHEGQNKEEGKMGRALFDGRFYTSRAYGDKYASINTPDLDLKPEKRYYISVNEQTLGENLVLASSSDEDRDRSNRAREKAAGTDPNNPDTDGDGFSDGAEAHLAKAFGLDPLTPNSREAFDTLYIDQCILRESSGECDYIQKISAAYGNLKPFGPPPGDPDGGGGECDLYCEPGYETRCSSCGDCSCCACVLMGCGNGSCDVGEDAASCPHDCNPLVCGDDTCAAGEEASCPADCGGGDDDGGGDDTPPSCGDGSCDGTENSTTCPRDCPGDGGGGDDTPPSCGNGSCDEGETQENCSADCGGSNDDGGGDDGGSSSCDPPCADEFSCKCHSDGSCECVPDICAGGGGGNPDCGGDNNNNDGGGDDCAHAPPDTCCPACSNGETCVLGVCESTGGCNPTDGPRACGRTDEMCSCTSPGNCRCVPVTR